MEGISLGLTVVLLVANNVWYVWGRRYQAAVPGSLQQERASAMRRKWRWPGFGFWVKQAAWWPYYVAKDVSEGDYVWAGVNVALGFVLFFLLRTDWRKLRRELEEDEDDWFNKMKKSGKRAWNRAKQAASSIVIGPVPVGAGA